ARRSCAAVARRPVLRSRQRSPAVRPALRAEALRNCSRLASTDRGLHRIVKAQHLAVDLGGIGLRILLQEKRRDVAAGDREEGLVGEQLDAARGIEDVSDVDLLALGL